MLQLRLLVNFYSSIIIILALRFAFLIILRDLQHICIFSLIFLRLWHHLVNIIWPHPIHLIVFLLFSSPRRNQPIFIIILILIFIFFSPLILLLVLFSFLLLILVLSFHLNWHSNILTGIGLGLGLVWSIFFLAWVRELVIHNLLVVWH